MPRYPKHTAGEEVQPAMTGYKMACCDCGLVHKVDFEVFRKQKTYPDGSYDIEEIDQANFGVCRRMERDERATAQKRRSSRYRTSAERQAAERAWDEAAKRSKLLEDAVSEVLDYMLDLSERDEYEAMHKLNNALHEYRALPNTYKEKTE